MQDLEQKVMVYNESEDITVRWDGREYDLSGDPITIERGIAEHWQARHPEVQLRIEELSAAEIERRTPVNPLEVNDRGEAFAGLKRTGRRRASGE